MISPSIVRSLMVFLLLAFLLIMPAQCISGGVLHVFPPTFQNETFAVARPSVLLSKVLVTVSESSVEYRIDQTFFNNNDFPLEGVYLLPVHTEDELQPHVQVNTVETPFEIVSGTDFFPTLQNLTLSMKDPSLLGLAGKRLVVVRPLHLGIRQQKSLRIQYNVPVHVENDQLELVLPLDGERYSLGPVGELDIRVRFKMSRPVRSVFSPTHHLTLSRETAHRCLVATRLEKKKVREDFRLIATFSTEEQDLKILTHRAPNAKGSFMALLSPPLVQPATQEPEKDVIFLLDTSGSVAKNESAHAKRAVIAGLERLAPHDRFNVLSMSTRVRRMADRMLPATEENIMEASRFVNSAGNAGGTDLYNGLIESLEQFTTRRRPCVIIFVGDGRGTVGIVNPDTILEDVRRYNRMRARLFVMALGDHADMAFLDKLAKLNRGTCFHFAGKEDFGGVLNTFFSQVSPAQVSDISLEFQDVSTEEMDPDPIPDLFGQESLAVFGRYDGKHDVTSRVRLRSKVRGRMKTLSTTATFPSVERRNSYVLTLWAMRRMSRLLEKHWLKGSEFGVQEQMEHLAGEFGFRVPLLKSAGGSDRSREIAHEAASRLFWRYKTSNVVSDVLSDRFRTVAGKTFRLEKTKWVDVEYRPSMPLRTCEYLGEEYFRMVKEDWELGPYFALGPEVLVVRDKGPVAVVLNSAAVR
ncbi:MAG TPA: VWA domain-containing protein [Desulfomonilaceae bacterium]|nr:VWA domain-containing protein [Desulfomonilaceae bacterium]